MCGRKLVAIAVAVVLGGCSALGSRSAGIHHEVREGENLFRIGKAYGVSHERLARANGLADPNRLRVGQRLFIPGGTRRLPVGMITPEAALEEAESIPFAGGRGVFIWPIRKGVLTSRFGPRGRSFHDGIDISAPVGTPVRAVRDGTVIYSDSLRGYGNVVIIRHGSGYSSVYAHNRENLVGAGSRVRQGQVIARLGSSGRTTGPNLHFEIRKNNVARNPVHFLPTETARRGKDSPT